MNVVLPFMKSHNYCVIDGCPESVFAVPGKETVTIRWPESDVGNIVVQCPCGSINESTINASISRECFGNYDEQAFWRDTDIRAACSYTERLLDLCALSMVSSILCTLHTSTV